MNQRITEIRKGHDFIDIKMHYPYCNTEFTVFNSGKIVVENKVISVENLLSVYDVDANELLSFINEKYVAFFKIDIFKKLNKVELKVNKYYAKKCKVIVEKEEKHKIIVEKKEKEKNLDELVILHLTPITQKLERHIYLQRYIDLFWFIFK
jgi:hypothetical protein